MGSGMYYYTMWYVLWCTTTLHTMVYDYYSHTVLLAPCTTSTYGTWYTTTIALTAVAATVCRTQVGRVHG
jgi:hypothetical protein